MAALIYPRWLLLFTWIGQQPRGLRPRVNESASFKVAESWVADGTFDLVAVVDTRIMFVWKAITTCDEIMQRGSRFSLFCCGTQCGRGAAEGRRLGRVDESGDLTSGNW